LTRSHLIKYFILKKKKEKKYFSKKKKQKKTYGGHGHPLGHQATPWSQGGGRNHPQWWFEIVG
jgi:hypothetical protein